MIFPLIGRHDIEDHSNRCGLPRTVRSDEAKNFSGCNLQRYVINRQHVRVLLSKMFCNDHNYSVMKKRSRGQSINHSGKRDGFPDVVQSADPGDGAFYSKAETRMRNRSVAAQIQIPFERRLRQIMFFQPAQRAYRNRPRAGFPR